MASTGDAFFRESFFASTAHDNLNLLTNFVADQSANLALGSCNEYNRKNQHRQRKYDSNNRNYHKTRERNQKGKGQQYKPQCSA